MCCFPKDETVLLDDGRSLLISSLRVGDRILASHLSDGLFFYDEVTFLSIARDNISAHFVNLETAAGNKLTLTPSHHLPVGAACCSDVRMAKHVQSNDTVWIHDHKSGAPIRTTVTKTETTYLVNAGLYNPLLKHGGLPVVDGVVTAFNTFETMKFESAVLPYVVEMCTATATCNLFKRAYTATECMLKHTNHFAKTGSLSAAPLCKRYDYLDGTIVHAGIRLDVPSTVALGLISTSSAILAILVPIVKHTVRNP